MVTFTKSKLGTHFAVVWNCNSNSNDSDHARIPHTLPSYDVEYDGIALVMCRPLNGQNEFYTSNGWVVTEPTTGRVLFDRNYGTLENTFAAMKRMYPNSSKLRDAITQQIKSDINLYA